YASNTPTMDIPSAVAHLSAAESALNEQPDVDSEAYLYAGLGSAAVWGGRTADGLSAAEQGMRLAEEQDNQPLWAYSATNYGWHQVSGGALARGFDVLESAWRVADELDRTTEAYRV